MTIVEVPGAAAVGAVYPDKSPAKYELHFTGSSGWVIHLSGGGWRFLSSNASNLQGKATSDPVPVPPLTADGVMFQENTVPGGAAASVSEHTSSSSGFGGGGCYGECDGILSMDPNQNPLFHSFNKVFVPISGTSFTGDRTSDLPYPVRGARILKAVIDHMQTAYNMTAASEVILTGGSSGGLATYLTCDRVGDMVKAANGTTRYTCLADAGFFLDYPDSPQSPRFEQSFYTWNSTAGTNQDCIAHYLPLGTPEKCIFAQYVLPFIKSDLFVMQNLYDSWQLHNILRSTRDGCGGYGNPGLFNSKTNAPCSATDAASIQKYGATMRGMLMMDAADPMRTSNRGIFAPSCIAHCQSVYNEHPASLWQWPERWGIDSPTEATTATPSRVFNAWYTKRGTGVNGQLVQQCDWSPSSCNAKCPLYT